MVVDKGRGAWESVWESIKTLLVTVLNQHKSINFLFLNSHLSLIVLSSSLKSLYKGSEPKWEEAGLHFPVGLAGKLLAPAPPNTPFASWELEALFSSSHLLASYPTSKLPCCHPGDVVLNFLDSNSQRALGLEPGRGGCRRVSGGNSRSRGNCGARRW